MPGCRWQDACTARSVPFCRPSRSKMCWGKLKALASFPRRRAAARSAHPSRRRVFHHGIALSSVFFATRALMSAIAISQAAAEDLVKDLQAPGRHRRRGGVGLLGSRSGEVHRLDKSFEPADSRLHVWHRSRVGHRRGRSIYRDAERLEKLYCADARRDPEPAGRVFRPDRHCKLQRAAGTAAAKNTWC